MKENCIICSSEFTDEIKVSARDVDSLKLIRCKSCLHEFQASNNYQDIYTNGSFTKKARSGFKVPSTEKIKSLDKRAISRNKYFNHILTNFKNTLEIGSSIGSFVNILKLRGIKSHGIEPDKDYAEFSNRQYGFKQEATLLEDFSPSNKFKSACSFHVLEHVQNPDRFILKTSELLEEHADVLFELPSLDLHYYGDYKTNYWTPHIHYFSLSSLYRLFSPYFDIKEIGFYGIAVYIYAKKNSNAKFEQKEFNRLLKKSKLIRRLIKATPSIPLFGKNKAFIKQLIWQPILQNNTKKVLLKYLRKAYTYTIADWNYLRVERKGSIGKKAFHISYFNLWENTGDTILSHCVRNNFNTQFKQKWKLKRVTEPVSTQTISSINKSKYLVVGGGGLLLPDSNPNNISGWQWSISKQQLQEINVPFIIYAIGYNYFPGQEPSDLFKKSLNDLISKADFFSLRNIGSIKRVKKLIPNEHHHKIHWQPCPTTSIRQNFKNLPKKTLIKKNAVAINVAFDRYQLRFKGNMHLILIELALALRDIHLKGYKLYVIGHLKEDFIFSIVLKSLGIPFTEKNLQFASPEKCFEFYNNVDLVFGSRGHAQMIPFGLNTKIISLGTHNKLKYFLEDIDAVDWFVDLNMDLAFLRECIVDSFEKIAEINKTHTEDRLIQKQLELNRKNEENFEIISRLIS